jgi:leucyl-tRNA synthetase
VYSDLVFQYIEALTILISPICPHWAQHVWELIGKSGFVVDARWPTVRPVDAALARQKTYLVHAAHGFRVKVDEQRKKLKTNAVCRSDVDRLAFV